MYSWDRGSGRPQNICDKLWQMMQSSDTKSENFDKDVAEILVKAHQIGWNESSKVSRVWVEKMMATVRDLTKEDLLSNPTDGKHSDFGC